MSEATTSCDALVCSPSPNFELVTWIADISVAIGPFVALASAIYLFFAGRKNDRRDQHNQRKIAVYSEFIEVLNQLNIDGAAHQKSRSETKTEYTRERVEELQGALSMMKLFAPDELFNLANSAIDQIMDPDDKIAGPSTGIVIEEMKLDLIRSGALLGKGKPK